MVATTPTGSGSGTRDRLVRAAITVGARDGWGGVTTRSVALEAQVNPGLVHYHVGSVAALRRLALERALAEVGEQAMADLQEDGGTAEGIGAILLALARGADRSTDAMAFVYEGFLAAPRDPELRSTLAAAVGGFRDQVTGWVDELSAGRPDRLDPAAVATVLVAVVDGLYLHRLLDERLDVAAAAAPLAFLASGGADR